MRRLASSLRVALAQSGKKNEGQTVGPGSRHGSLQFTTACAALAALLSLQGCQSLAIVAAGLGGSTAVSHTLNGITYRTFTASSAKVRKASMQALNRMGMKSTPATATENGEVIRASANQREIQI